MEDEFANFEDELFGEIDAHRERIKEMLEKDPIPLFSTILDMRRQRLAYFRETKAPSLVLRMAETAVKDGECKLLEALNLGSDCAEFKIEA